MYIRRVYTLFCAMILLSGALILKLYDIAMYDDTAVGALSGQYTRKVAVLERTGFVFDRNENIISHKTDGGVCVINPQSIRDENDVVEYLEKCAKTDINEIIEKLYKNEPFTLALENVPDQNAPCGLYVFEKYDENDNFFCRHLLGYRNADGKGVAGVYRRFGETLSFLSGSIEYTYEADPKNKPFSDNGFRISDKNYSAKNGVVLTIDERIQRICDEVCDENLVNGAVVVCDVSDNSIAAISSRPLYEKDNIAKSLDSPSGDLINKAFALYTPGSVFKTVVAASALEKNPGLFDFEYECTGSVKVGEKVFRCHNLAGHGKQTMKEAYANSCNTYFYTLASKVGYEEICYTAKEMGLGEETAFSGINVRKASIPKAEESHPALYLANMAIGQGDLLFSPVDVMKIILCALSGEKASFSLVKRIIYPSGSAEIENKREKKRVLCENTVEKLKIMMRYCVTDGTGKEAYTPDISSGAKTATAQTGQFEDGREILHKWFAGYFPEEKPQYAVVVFCDGHAKNNASAAKIFKELAKRISFTNESMYDKIE